MHVLYVCGIYSGESQYCGIAQSVGVSVASGDCSRDGPFFLRTYCWAADTVLWHYDSGHDGASVNHKTNNGPQNDHLFLSDMHTPTIDGRTAIWRFVAVHMEAFQ